MRWFLVRKAVIPEGERDVFERFGVNVIGAVLGGGFNPRAIEIQPVYNDDNVRAHALAWMTEQYDRTDRKETWLITMEVSITGFVFAELILSTVSWLFPHLGGNWGGRLAHLIRSL
jgi:hypothetical protein